MKNQLIPVFAGSIQGRPAQLVDARVLHAFLEVSHRFNDWITNRIEEYGFVIDQDFLSFTKNLVKPQGGRPGQEYHLMLDTAKELAMVERNEKGREARRYFIECERRYLEGLQAKLAKKAAKPLPDPAAARAGMAGKIVAFLMGRPAGARKIEIINDCFQRNAPPQPLNLVLMAMVAAQALALEVLPRADGRSGRPRHVYRLLDASRLAAFGEDRGGTAHALPAQILFGGVLPGPGWTPVTVRMRPEDMNALLEPLGLVIVPVAMVQSLAAWSRYISSNPAGR